jgi:four helix bundle protein
MIGGKSDTNFDLEERTATFGEEIIGFCKPLPIDDINKILIKQLVRSATSIGANYMEANGADSKKDFRNKISLCKKEAKETMHWIRMLAKALPYLRGELRALWQEAKELSLIFGAINRN